MLEQPPLLEPLMLVVKDRSQPRKRLLPRREQLLLHRGSEPQLIKLK